MRIFPQKIARFRSNLLLVTLPTTISGGYNMGGVAALLMDVDSGEVTALPDMPEEKFYHMCGAVPSPSGGVDIVVAGGDDDSSVNIYNMEEGVWRPGPKLPQSVEKVCFKKNTPFSVYYSKKKTFKNKKIDFIKNFFEQISFLNLNKKQRLFSLRNLKGVTELNGCFLKFWHSPIFNFVYPYSIFFLLISGRLRHLPGLFPRRRRDELQHLPGEKPLFFPKKSFYLFFPNRVQERDLRVHL